MRAAYVHEHALVEHPAHRFPPKRCAHPPPVGLPVGPKGAEPGRGAGGVRPRVLPSGPPPFVPRFVVVTETSAHIELPVLEALAEEPSLSQRELARRAGLSLTRAHFVLRRLVEKGLVKVQSAAQSEHKLGYLYLLTPQGLEAKAKLTYSFLQHAAEQYREMSDRVDRVLAPAVQRERRGRGKVRVAVVGEGPLAEVVRARVALRNDTSLEPELGRAQVAVVVDPAAALSHTNGTHIVRLA